MRTRTLLGLALAWLLAGCSVLPLPGVTPLRGQSVKDREWDTRDCRWTAQRASHYDPSHSPAANFIQDVVFWGIAGASVGGLITGFPGTVAGEATEGLIAGSGAGGIVGAAQGLRGPQGFERAYRACMESRGYTVATVREEGTR